MIYVTHSIYFSSGFFFFFFKVLFQTLFEVNAQNVQKSRETVFWLLIFPPFPFAPVFSPLGGGVL